MPEFSEKRSTFAPLCFALPIVRPLCRRLAGWLMSFALAAPMLAAPVPPFQDTVVISGLTAPTAVRFAPDGQIFVAEKAGLIKRFDGLDDPTPEIVADLSASVYDFWDRGLLGLALDPEFPKEPDLFVLYTLDAPPGGVPPVWHDTCPTTPGANVDGCVASGRLSRLELDLDGGSGAEEQVLIDGAWCQQFPSHSIGTVAFGPDGALYVGAGDGAAFHTADYGQLGGALPGTPTPRNPCGDPPAGPGGMMTPPTAEGGALRSQDLRTPADPTGWHGAILRLDPDTGEALPDNPLYGGQNAGDDPIIAYGLRNPFRFTIDTKTGELWIGDVGWSTFEEIDHVADPTDAVVENFGWPCFEGDAHQSQYDLLDLDLCETLYVAPAVTAPFFAYRHGSPPDPKRCDGPNNQASIAGLALYTGVRYPARLHNALFFADHNRGCLWAIPRGTGGQLDPAQLETIVSAAGGIVDLTAGPDGDLFYVDHLGGTVHRITVDPTYVFGDAFESGDTSGWSAVVP